jgi:hypothetical protein
MARTVDKFAIDFSKKYLGNASDRKKLAVKPVVVKAGSEEEEEEVFRPKKKKKRK